MTIQELIIEVERFNTGLTAVIDQLEAHLREAKRVIGFCVRCGVKSRPEDLSEDGFCLDCEEKAEIDRHDETTSPFFIDDEKQGG